MEYEELRSYLKDVYEVEKQLFTLREIANLYKKESDELKKESGIIYFFDAFLDDADKCSQLHLSHLIGKSILPSPDCVEKMSSDEFQKTFPVISFILRWNCTEECKMLEKQFHGPFRRYLREKDYKQGSNYRKAFLEVYTPHYYRDLEEKKKICLSRYEKLIKEYNDVILATISTSEQVLSSIYAKDIIHPKYRNFLAIAQIYEYLDTGRCTELVGPNGAYNLYEQELRQNTIIDRLDVIVTQLEILNRTMSYVATAINQGNSLLRDISSSLGRIEANTALTAYNSQCIANNTNIANRYNY